MDTKPFLSSKTMNQDLLRLRNPMSIVSQTAKKIQADLAEGKANHPFKEVISANYNNPHAASQPPITFYRQVIAVLLYPELQYSGFFPDGVVKRVRYYLERMAGGLGPYGPSPGHVFVRESIAKFLGHRDGVPSHIDHIQMTDGSASAVADIISGHINNEKDGVMIPVPQYSLYSGNINYFGGTSVPYYLDEENHWQISVKHLISVYKKAAEKGIQVKMLVVINPGNPTGQVLKQEIMAEIVKFCYQFGVSLFADEVYQDNNWTNEWVPFRRIVGKLNSPFNRTPTYSIHSASKGWYGECGLRGGYVEFLNVDKDVESKIKMIETLPISCSTVGQVVMDMIVNPPTEEFEGKEVTELYLTEKNDILKDLRKNAELCLEYFGTKMKNVSIVGGKGSTLVFPRIKLNKRVEEEAAKLGYSPDLFYALEGLKATGLALTEGSVFDEKPGTYHISCSTLIRPSDKFEEALKAWVKFNDEFQEKYQTSLQLSKL
jgi:aspartate/methionine/tyrosine aminotransferase